MVWQSEREDSMFVLHCQTHIAHFVRKSVLSGFSTPFGPQSGDASWLIWCVLLGSMFEVLFCTTFEGNRQSAGSSE